MSKNLNIYKPLGKTSVEMIEILREKYPEYQNQKISYAGRLDPMASGVLILLIGEDENKARREREKSDKEYSFTGIFGIGSDTFDICGIPTVSEKIPTIDEIKNVLPNFIGNIKQEIPIYSAYRVRGKPMYVLAAQGKLKPEDIPTIEREVYSLNITGYRNITAKELLKEAHSRLKLITRGDFRQEKILLEYDNIITNSERNFLQVEFTSHVSSGTYVRSLCNDIGKAVNSKGISLEIIRSRSGEYNISESMKII